MENKKLGIILIIVSLVILILLGFIRNNVTKAYRIEIDKYIESGESCPSDPDICPHEQRARAQIPLFIAGALLLGVITLGLYLIFFEKSQKEIISTLEKHKKIQTEDEKFQILTKAMDEYEKKVLKAVREQKGITQSTLRYRTDISKSKLSSILTSFEKKGLIKRVPKGKTMEIYLK